MASIEYLEKRVAGKEKEIAKFEKKLQRILQAKESNWEKNPYYYLESDIIYTTRDLEESKKALENYKTQLNQEIEKSNSRNIEVIVNFLEQWKTECKSWFLEQKSIYDKALIEYRQKDHELVTAWNSSRGNSEERKELDRQERELRKKFRETWTHVTQFFHGDLSFEETLEKDLEQEKNRKYDDLVERTNKIVGQITDASYLNIDEKGNLNGYVIGTRGKASVTTIGAGGYNIQCFHFRTLIHEIK